MRWNMQSLADTENIERRLKADGLRLFISVYFCLRSVCVCICVFVHLPTPVPIRVCMRACVCGLSRLITAILPPRTLIPFSPFPTSTFSALCVRNAWSHPLRLSATSLFLSHSTFLSESCIFLSPSCVSSLFPSLPENMPLPNLTCSPLPPSPHFLRSWDGSSGSIQCCSR